MRFQLTPRSMTLHDLELYKFEFSENFADFGRNNRPVGPTVSDDVVSN